MSTAKPYAVNLWSAHPDSGEDACTTGADFASLAEALAAADDLWSHFNRTYRHDISHIEIDGPDHHEVRVNPDYKPRRRDDDGEWRREQAMQLGMGHGHWRRVDHAQEDRRFVSARRVRRVAAAVRAA